MKALLKKQKTINTTLTQTDKIGIISDKKNSIPFSIVSSLITLVVLYCLSRIMIDSFGIFNYIPAGKTMIYLSREQIIRFWITAFFFCIPILAACSLKKYSNIAMLSVAALYSFFFVYNYKSVSNGFVHALNKAMYTVMELEEKGGDIYFVPDFPINKPANELIMFCMAVVLGECFLLAFSFVYRSSPIIYTAVVVLFSALPFTFNVFVGEKYLVAASVSCIVVYVCSIAGSSKGTQRNGLQMPFDQSIKIDGVYANDVSFLQCVCILVCVLLILTPVNIFADFSKYKKSEKTQQLGEDILDVAETIIDGDFDLIGSSRNKLSSGDLTRVGNLEYTGDIMFKITDASLPIEPLYLKSYTGAVYTSKKWEEISDTMYSVYAGMWSEFETDNFYPQFCSGEILRKSYSYDDIADVLRITNVNLNHKTLLTHTNLLAGEMSPELLENTCEYDKSPVFSAFKNKKNYYERFYSLNKINSVLGGVYADSGIDSDIYGIIHNGEFRNIDVLYDDELYKNEGLYRKFVAENYLDCPKNIDSYLPAGYDELIANIFNYVHGAEGEYNPYTVTEYYNAVIQYTRTYLGNNSKYTLSPGNTPVNKDFVEYFMNENKKGYCVHFATAGALFLRRAGIPARYAEGFYVSERDCSLYNQLIGTMEVPDSSAHAWVEVYYPLVGWQPVDFTPSYYDETKAYDDDLVYSDTDNKNENKGKDTDSGDKAGQSDSSKNTQAVISGVELDTSNSVSETDTENETDTDDDKLNITPKKAALGAVLIVIGYILYYSLKLAGWLLLRWLFIKLREKRFNEENTIVSAKALYKHSLFLLRVSGIKPDKGEGDIEFAKRAMNKLNEEYTVRYKVFTQTAQQAKFSQNAPSTEAIKEMNDFINTLTKYIYESSGKIKKVIIKYVLFLI